MLKNRYYGNPYYDTAAVYPENDGYLFGGYPEIPGVIGDGASFGENAGFYEEGDIGAGNGEVREKREKSSNAME